MQTLAPTQLIQPDETSAALRVKRYDAATTGNLVEFLDESGNVIGYIDYRGNVVSNAHTTANLDFTDGDTFKRFTIADTRVVAGSKILCSVQRPNTADVDDAGWVFVPTVVSVSVGSFDVNVAALVLGEPAINGEGPNETPVLCYTVE